MTDKPYLGDALDYYGITFNPSRLSQKIHCPVHDDSISSCSVNLEEEGWYKCHACGSQGDSLNLIMAKEGVDFAAALRLAEGIVTDGSHAVSKSTDSRTDGLLGRTRVQRRDDSGVRFRPSFRSNGRA